MTGGRPRLLTVVIPAMNEEAGIGQVLEAIPRDRLREIGWDTEIVVVDGESVDRTRDIAAEKSARVVVEPRRGYGRAYKTGFERAKGEVIATGDADTTYPFEKLPELVATLERENLDFLTTDRLGGLEQGAMGSKHRFGNSVLSTTMRALFLVDVRDSQSGMWLLRRSALERLRLTSDGMPFSEEIKIEAFTRGLRAREVPIPYRARVGEVKLNSYRDGWRNLVFLFRKRLGIAEPDS